MADIKLKEFLRGSPSGGGTKVIDDLHTELAAIKAKLLTAPATEAKQDNVITQLDITLSALRDAITDSGGDAKTLNDLHTKLTALETDVKAIKDDLQAGDAKVQLSGSNTRVFEKIRDVEVAAGATTSVSATVDTTTEGVNWVAANAGTDAAHNWEIRVTFARDGVVASVTTAGYTDITSLSAVVAGGTSQIKVAGELVYVRIKNDDSVARSYDIDFLGGI